MIGRRTPLIPPHLPFPSPRYLEEIFSDDSEELSQDVESREDLQESRLLRFKTLLKDKTNLQRINSLKLKKWMKLEIH